MLPTLEDLTSLATYAKLTAKADRFQASARQFGADNSGKYLYFYDPGYKLKSEGTRAMNGVVKLNGDITISIAVGDVLSFPPSSGGARHTDQPKKMVGWASHYGYCPI